VPYACKFCIALYGLKGRDVKGLPADADLALEHVRQVHGYPKRTALEVLGDTPAHRLAARLIEDTGPVVEVRLITELT